MASRFLNLSVDTTLGGNAPSDEIVPSQKAIKDYVDSHSGGGGLPDQTGNAGKFLTTDGTDASWSDKPLVNNSTAPNTTVAVTTSTPGSKALYSVFVGKGELGINSAHCVCVGYQFNLGINADYSTIIGDTSAAFYGATYGIAIGAYAKVSASYATQIGSTGSSTINSDANTVKIANANGNFEIMSADGTIPTDRFTTTPVADGTYVPTLTISSGTATRSWAAPGGGSSYTAGTGINITSNVISVDLTAGDGIGVSGATISLGNIDCGTME